MINVILFVITVAFWVIVWDFITTALRLIDKSKSSMSLFKKVIVVSLLSMPFSINGNIFTVLGNAKSEKGIYSLSSFYQDANGGPAFAIFALPGYQHSKHLSLSFVSILNYQKSGGELGSFFPIVSIQIAKDNANSFAGLLLAQVSDNGSSNLYIGVSCVQNSEVESFVGIGASFYQKARLSRLGFGVSLYQEAENLAQTVMGVAGVQNADRCSCPMALSLYQIKDPKDKSFVLFTVDEK